MLRKGKTQAGAAGLAGVHRQGVNRWIGLHRDEGALQAWTPGSSRKGSGILTASEARRVQRWICDKMPDQMKLPFALWTAQAVRELIQKKLGKMPGLSTMPLYLKRWGFTSQKPLTRPTSAIRERSRPGFDRIIRALRRGRSARRW